MMQGSMSVLNPVRRIINTFEDIIDTHQPITNKKACSSSRSATQSRRLGLPPDVLNAYPHQLSGGMRQRVAIALATVFHPGLIIADEPTTALDVVVQRGVLQMLKDIQAESGNTVLLVTHDMAVHANVANRVAIMYAGRIVEEGPTRGHLQCAAPPVHPAPDPSLPMIGDKSSKASLGGHAAEPGEPTRTAVASTRAVRT